MFRVPTNGHSFIFAIARTWITIFAASHPSTWAIEEKPMFALRPPRRRRHGTAEAGRPLPAACSVEPLEGRLLFTTYTVTTLGDSAGSVTPNGTGKFNATTLRAALAATNA